MKMDSVKHNVASTSVEDTSFDIHINEAAFEIISSEIYEHKIAAIVRELCCNAADSHIKSGNPDPFEVILPNEFNPNFTITDYGTGLDDEETRTIFASVFNSTKRHSNEETGAFGLGSKTPFSYTDSFNVRCRKDGEERFYVCKMNEQGIPAIGLLYEKSTDERNGVSVSVPVQRKDFNKFISECEVILSFFDVPFEVKSSDSFSLLSDDVYSQIETKGYANIPVYTESDLYSGNKFYALMGRVIYRIPYSIHDEFDRKINLLKNSNAIIVPFDLGQLRPAASRETLSMKGADFRTRIISRFNEVSNHALGEIQEKVESAGDVFSSMEILDEYFPDVNRVHLEAFTRNGKTLHNILYGNNKRLPIKLMTSFRLDSVHGHRSRLIYKSNNSFISRDDLHSILQRRRTNPDQKKYLFAEDPDKEKGIPVGWKANVRKWARSECKYNDRFFIVDRKLSQSTINRLIQLSGDSIEYVDYSVIQDWMKSNHKGFTCREINQDVKDTTVYAQRYVFHKTSNGSYKEAADNYPTDEEGVHYFFTTEDDSIGDKRFLKVIDPDNPLLNDKIVVFKMNCNNQKKLLRLGITKDWRKYKNEILAKDKSLAEAAYVYRNFLCSMSPEPDGYFDLDQKYDFIQYSSNESCKRFMELTKSLMGDLWKRFGDDTYVSYLMADRVDTNDASDDLKELIDLGSTLREQYRLVKDLPYLGESKMRELVNVIDFAMSHGYTSTETEI